MLTSPLHLRALLGFRFSEPRFRNSVAKS
ncbi:hypothetical protein CBM2589_B190006 [Cupriavidus taiwanensis]|uniref:Uncharacterized protein n=1 Tax=Cupriavidus taiwanensis TaxID=164546 RepID=A0A975WXJ4_9BURK|nr:hypothetical protein CBM2589_B190006 [Cupriavidus taiwanensis]